MIALIFYVSQRIWFLRMIDEPYILGFSPYNKAYKSRFILVATPPASYSIEYYHDRHNIHAPCLLWLIHIRRIDFKIKTVLKSNIRTVFMICKDPIKYNSKMYEFRFPNVYHDNGHICMEYDKAQFTKRDTVQNIINTTLLTFWDSNFNDETGNDIGAWLQAHPKPAKHPMIYIETDEDGEYMVNTAGLRIHQYAEMNEIVIDPISLFDPLFAKPGNLL